MGNTTRDIDMVYSISDYKVFAAIIDYLAFSSIGYYVDNPHDIHITERLDKHEICTIEEIIDGRAGT